MTTQCYKKILVALDSSSYAKMVLAKAVELAKLTPESQVTAVHVTTSPHQKPTARAIMDRAKRICSAANVEFKPLILQGKEYRMLLSETLSGEHDLLVIGYKGKSGAPEEKMGGVCELVVRRVSIDTFVVGSDEKKHRPGPILALVDGSEKSLAGAWSAVELGKRRQQRVILGTVFNADYHQTLLETIIKLDQQTGMNLSESEQWLTIPQYADNSGWNSVYQNLLDLLANTISQQKEVEISFVLMTGLTDIAIRLFMLDHEPSLLVIGKTGIHHADASLTIGSTTDKLLHTATCSIFMTTCDILISSRSQPSIIGSDEVTALPPVSQPQEEQVTRKILIVDDEYAHREYMLAILSGYGHCDIATNGVEAVERYEKALAQGRAYDMVTLDVDMPVMNGHQTLRAIRSKEKEWDLSLGGRTAVFMVTSLDSQDHIDTASQDGCTNYFTKPVDGNLLIESIQKRISLGQQARQRNTKPRRIPKLDRVIDTALKPLIEKWSDQKMRLNPIRNEKCRSATELSIILDAAIKRSVQGYWKAKKEEIVEKTEKEIIDKASNEQPALAPQTGLWLRGIYEPLSYGFVLTVNIENRDGMLLDSIEIKIEKDLIPKVIGI